MVLGLLTIAAIPTVIGTSQAISARNKQEKDEKLAAEFRLVSSCTADSPRRGEVDGKIVVLRDGKLFLGDENASAGFPFKGYYLTHPSTNTPGLVSFISEAPPMLNWVYIDRDTLEVKYGNRSAARGHILGPWGWAKDEVGLTLEGWENFVAVEEGGGVWAVYFDPGDDGGVVLDGRMALEVSLEREVVSL